MPVTSYRSASAELLDADLVARARTCDARAFNAFVNALESLRERCARDGAWSETLAAARCLKAAGAGFPVDVHDVERAFYVSEAFARECVGVDDECAHEWCVGLCALIDRYGEDLGGVVCHWEPMFARVETFLQSDAKAYSGYGSCSATRARYMTLVRKCRRFFPDGAARAIWERVAEDCRATEDAKCFAGLGLLHLFTPCMQMSTPCSDELFFVEMMNGEWVTLSHALGSSSFWTSGWISMFSQLAKHDLKGKINWKGVYDDMLTVTLRVMELPIGGIEGRRSFGRKVSFKAAMTFGSQLESRRVRTVAKLLVYRAMCDDAVVEYIAKIIDYIEHFYHPSSSGSFSGNLASFLRYLIKYTNKFVGYEKRVVRPEVLARLVPVFKRITDRAVFSKSSDLRRYAAIGIGRLAYMNPELILPSVMSRFEEALAHETATRQLVPAMNCLTLCVRQIMLLPTNTIFQDDQEAYVNVSEFLASALNAALPGIDVNDSSKTCATLRFFCVVVTNLPRLVDVGENGAVSCVPILWSEWTVHFLERLFTLFEHLQPDTHGSKSDAADAFKGGARHAAGFLLSTSTMYSPLLRILFERLDPSIRSVAIMRVAAFIRDNTLPEICEEVARLVSAALFADTELVIREILRPAMVALDEDLDFEGELSTTAEARIFWNSCILTKCTVASREAALALREDFMNVTRKMFKVSETCRNLDLMSYAELHVSAILKGLLSVEVIDTVKDEVEGDSVTDWVNLKWRLDQGGNVIGEQHLPTPLSWRLPGEGEFVVAQAMIDEFLVAPAHALLQVTNEDAMDCDDASSSKDWIRTNVSMMVGALGGLEDRLKDFSDSDSALLITGHALPFTDSTPRTLAARALVAAIQKTGADDTDTLSLICSAAKAVVNPARSSYKFQKKSLAALNSIGYYFTQPKTGGQHSRYPRWFVAEKARLSLHWRNAMSVYFSGSASPFNLTGPSSDVSRNALLGSLQDLALSKYVSVRCSALPVVQGLSDRYPKEIVPFVELSVKSLAKSEEDEDKCIAACEALKAHEALGELFRNESVFVPFVEALLGSSHHGTEKAQNAIGALFLHFALLFTRGLFHPKPRIGITVLQERLLASLKSETALHWSYEMMTNAMSVFFVDSQDDPKFLASATEQFMRSILGDLKVVRFPAMCALLMMSRYECFESNCAPMILRMMSADPESSCKSLLDSFGIAHSAIDNSESRGRTNGKADALMQAAESLYGFAQEMSSGGADWPTSRAADFLPQSGAFITAVARFWQLLTRIAPVELTTGLRAAIKQTSDDSDRSERCAISEALAGALASRSITEIDRQWMQDTFLKYALDAPTDQREEWLKGAAWCTDSGNENVSDSLLRHLSSTPMGTVAQTARGLELTRVCIAQLGHGRGMDIKQSLMDLLADPTASPLAHESRLVRETGAQLAASLLAECDQALNAARSKLITLFTADIENVVNRALLSDPAQPDAIMTPSRNALEGIFYTFLELVRRGDALTVEPSIPLILRAALRTAESKDKDFAMVSKLTIAYLKYLNFEKVELRAFTEVLGETTRDDNWHTRAATLRYIQALIYHHAFTIDSGLFAMLRECVLEALHDKQLEVAQLASHTLMIFLKGVGAADESTLRDRFLKIVSVRLPSDANSELIMHKHAAVLGLSACVLSNPYEVPSWMPEVMEALGFASLEPSPIKQATQHTFAEFKKTHQDAWTQTRAAFTHEQWENVSLGLDLAPSYII
jgi:proteasome activator subunit 4